MERYQTYSDKELYELLRGNMNALARSMDGVYPDDSFPDPRDRSLGLRHTRCDDYIDVLRDNYQETQNRLEVESLMARILVENVEIEREMLRRIP